MISIITRCYNRLEFTIQVLNKVRELRGDYEHIIIDNGSTDGTPEWFRWMSNNTNWYYNMRYYRFDRNLGDWQGMIKGFLHAKGDYIVQLDNDIIPHHTTWLKDMVNVLENTDYKTVMLRRLNVAWKLKPLGPNERIDHLIVAPVERAVACWMTSMDTFEVFVQKITKSERSKYEIRKIVGNTAKIINRTCEEMDTERVKYNPKNKNVWAKL